MLLRPKSIREIFSRLLYDIPGFCKDGEIPNMKKKKSAASAAEKALEKTRQHQAEIAALLRAESMR